MSLLSLPGELVIEIIKLSRPDGFQNLLLTSKKMYEYGRFLVKQHNEDVRLLTISEFHLRQHHPQLSLLQEEVTQSLESHESKFAYIKQIRTTLGGHFNKEVLHTLLRTLNHILPTPTCNLKLPRNIYAQFSEPVARFIASAPNLHTLILSGMVHHLFQFLAAEMYPANSPIFPSTSKPPFSSLRILKIQTTADTSCLSVEDVIPFLTLPTLREAVLAGDFTAPHSTFGPPHSKHQRSYLVLLELYGSITMESLEQLLEPLSSIRHVLLRQSTLQEPWDSDRMLKLINDMVGAVLKSVSVVTTNRGTVSQWMRGDREDPSWSIDSQCFPALTFFEFCPGEAGELCYFEPEMMARQECVDDEVPLKVPHVYTENLFEHLRPSIETLSLFFWPADRDEAQECIEFLMLKFQGVKAPYFRHFLPRLKRVILPHWVDYTEDSEEWELDTIEDGRTCLADMEKALASQLRRHGIELVVVHENNPHDDSNAIMWSTEYWCSKRRKYFADLD
jgi:hypothetical protein